MKKLIITLFVLVVSSSLLAQKKDTHQKVQIKITELGKVQDSVLTKDAKGNVKHIPQTSLFPKIQAGANITIDDNNIRKPVISVGNLTIQQINNLQSALDLKADLADVNSHILNTNNPHNVTKAQVGLYNVDNTSDANKPISTATQSALDLKADLADVNSHILNTNNPHNVTKAQVGLSNVDNISSVNMPISTATQSALDTKINNSEKAAPNGVATLEVDGKIPMSQIPDALIGAVNYVGLWDANSNSPALVSPTDSSTKGQYYIVNVAGTQFGIAYKLGDYIISDGNTWGKVDNNNAVDNVFGRKGSVTALEGDYQSFYPRLSFSYNDPSWIASLDYGKLINTPTTLSGYGITDTYTKIESESRYVNVTGDTMTGDLTAPNFIGNGSGLTDVDADLLDGHHASTTRNSANTIPVRDGNGYLNLGWINTTSGNTTNTITDIYVNTNDGYIRKATPAHFRSQITDGVYLPVGSKAADSNLLDGLDSRAYLRDNGWNSNPGGQDANTQPGMSSDFSYSNNAPWTGDLIRFGSSGYSLQLSSAYSDTTGRLSFRTRNGDNNTYNPWRQIWHTGNFNPSSYLTTSGKATDSNLLDGLDSSAFLRSNTSDTFTSGTFTFGTGTIALLKDNVNFRLGTGSDTRMYHNGSHTYIDHYTGNLYFRDNTTTRITFERTTGNITANDFILSSDKRKKHDIKTLDKDLDIDFVEYKYNGTDRTRYGVIADDVEKVAPELVTVDDEGFKQVSYIDLLIRKVSELEKENEEIKNKNEELEKENSKILNEIELIKKHLKL